MSLSSIVGIDKAIQDALAKVPGLEAGLMQQVQDAITAEIAGLKTLEDPVLVAFNQAVEELAQMRKLFAEVIVRGIHIDLGGTPPA
jgi:hypothetical protein